MLKKNQALIITLAISIIAIVVIAGYYTLKLDSQSSSNSLIDDGPDVTYDGSRYRNFESEELGITFTYPAAWGDLTEWIKAPPEELSQYRLEATISAYDTPFMMLVSDGEVMGRGGWWGDIAHEAADDATVELFCDVYKDIDAYYIQPNDACEILINENGVTFARLGGTTSWFGWDVEETYVYLVSNPDHMFYGIALSAQSLRRTDLEDTIGNAEKAVQEIANSLSFIE